MLKNNQKGFTLVEGLLIVLVLTAVVGVGFYVFDTNKKDNSSDTKQTQNTHKTTETTTEPTTKTYTDSNNLFTLNYLADWVAWEADIRTDTPFDLANSKMSNFAPSKESEVNVTIFAFKTSDTEAALKSYVYGDKQTPIEDLIINGATAKYIQDIVTSEAVQSPTFTNDIYTITHNGVTLLVTFKEAQGAGPNGAAFDATDSVDEFKALAKSIKFLN